MATLYLKILTNANFPNVICSYSENNPNCLSIHTLRGGIFEEKTVKVGSIIPKDASVKLWSWNQGPREGYVNLLTFAFSARLSTGPPAVFIVNFAQNQQGDYFISNHIELGKDSLFGSKLQRSHTLSDITIEQIYWQPFFGSRVAVRYTETNQCLGIVVWEFFRGNVPENDDCGKPTHLVEEAVAHMKWCFTNTIYFITQSTPRASLKVFDIVTGNNQVIYNFETKTQIVDFQIEASGKHFSYLHGSVLSINQGSAHLHDVDLSKKLSSWNPNLLIHEWNPHVPNQLMILVKTPSLFCLVDLFYSEPSEGSKLSIPPLLRWFNLEMDVPIATFCWAPWKRAESCDVLVLQNDASTLQTLQVPSYLCSPGFDQNFNICAVRKGSIFSLENTNELTLDSDISTLMQWRVQNAYGPSYQWTSNIFQNDTDLQNHWNRLNHLKQCSQKNMGKFNERFPKKQAAGIPGVLDVFSGVNPVSEEGSRHFKLKFLDRQLDNTIYDSLIRKSGLGYCEWNFNVINDAQLDNLEPFIERVHSDSNEAGAALAWVHSRAQLCLTYLDKVPDAAFSLALSAVNYSPLWLEKCKALKIKNPYLKALFGFLGNPQDPIAVLRADLTEIPCHATRKFKSGLPGMRFEDHVAFALKLLPDDQLEEYLRELANVCTEYGVLEGLFLTGINSKSIKLLQSYLDRTADVQTVVLTLLFSNSRLVQFSTPASSQWEPADLDLINSWMEQYCLLLDSWQLYSLRAEFDRAAYSFRAYYKPTQIVACCTFCSTPLNSSDKKDLMQRSNHSQFTTSEQKIAHACKGCGNFLPRCCVCLQLLGTTSSHQPQAPRRDGKKKTSQSPTAANPPSHYGSQLLSNYGDSNRSQVSPVTAKSAMSVDSNKKNAFDFWFVWCNSCNHGGHAAHVSQWFSGHSTCPVEKCKCRCSGFE